ncbi:MAG: putative lipid II flippase FtsW [Lentilitoribacter sp.]
MVSRIERGAVANWFWTIDRFLLIAFVVLILLGFMLSFSASPAVAERIGLDSFHFVKRFAIFMVPALVALVAISFLDARMVRRAAILLLLGAVAMMVLTLFVGSEIKGSRRWLSIAGFTLQPSEFMKPAFVIICAWLFSERSRHPEIPGNLFAIILFGIVAALLVAQPDLGQTMLLTAVWGAMFFMAGMPWVWILALGGLAIAGFVTAYTIFPHVAGRIDRFLTGEGDTFQVDTAREAIIRGDWFGRGPGEGTIKRILPDSHTDFIFSVAAEEFGILFCIALVSIFAFVVLRTLLHAARETDEFTRLAVSGLALLIGAQSMINIGVNLELLPAKGMTLPFISYGGSSMLAIAITVGFILALTRHRPEKRARNKIVMPSKVKPSLAV